MSQRKVNLTDGDKGVQGASQDRDYWSTVMGLPSHLATPTEQDRPKSDTKFEQLGKLPAGIQIMIWDFALERDERGTTEKLGHVLALQTRAGARSRDAWEDRFEVRRDENEGMKTSLEAAAAVGYACYASRERYWKRFSLQMPVKRGIVRYSEGDTVYLHDLRWTYWGAGMLLHERPKTGSYPAWFDHIKLLALSPRIVDDIYAQR